jgi:hypothetical protein
MGILKSVWLRAVLLIAAIAVPLFLATQNQRQMPAPAVRKAVVVELFTSEGCSSCPPADALLGRLRQEKVVDGVEVVPLGLHVDYWDFQGWRDRFSSAAYSERQLRYASKLRISGPYTPQMVVDGAAEFEGGDAPRARTLIARAAARPASADIQLTLSTDKLQVQVKAQPAVDGEVLLAITEDNLQTKVIAGENGGHELRHSAVVRDLRSLGRLHNGIFEAAVPLNLKKDWKRDDLRIVVFVQEPHTGPIDGAAWLQLAAKPVAAN